MDCINPIQVANVNKREKKPAKQKKGKIADVVELPITVVNNVLY